jgi:hypothetical protein
MKHDTLSPSRFETNNDEISSISFQKNEPEICGVEPQRVSEKMMRSKVALYNTWDEERTKNVPANAE